MIARTLLLIAAWTPLVHAETPIAVHLPTALTQPNWQSEHWRPRKREGSCVHAAFSHLLHWQGQHALADAWRNAYAGGVMFSMSNSELANELDRLGIRYAQTIGQVDVAFLQKAIATRRGAGVSVRGGAHMVLLVGMDDQHALIIDVNHPTQLQTWPLADFIREWAAARSWAITPVYTPHAPLPTYQ